MKKGLWLSLKRNRIWAELYHHDEMVAIISVNEQSKNYLALLSLEMVEGMSFKIVKKNNTEIDNENFFNKEEFNK